MKDLHGSTGRGWVGVDLDGTLAEYHGWKGVEHIGPPVPRMLERVKRWIAAGQEVKILTARVHPGRSDWYAAAAAIRRWLKDHLGPAGESIELTCTKDSRMVELWDDRAVQVVPNTGERVDGRE